MIVYLAILAVQVMLIIDVIRNGRNQLWIMALKFLSEDEAARSAAARFGGGHVSLGDGATGGTAGLSAGVI